VRKEDIVARILEKRGDGPGLVAILSALETCESYEARYDKKTGRTSLRPDRAKCTHYYFYFIDEQLGLCFMRISTWCPFPAQVYVNVHNLLAAKLRTAAIGYRMLDNAFCTSTTGKPLRSWPTNPTLGCCTKRSTTTPGAAQEEHLQPA
jgi:hypothetical protein